MKPTQLELLTTVSAPSLSPDGRWAVASASRPNLTSDSYTGQLWLVDVSGAEAPRRLTRGAADAAPAYSPDGTLVAFLRQDADGRPQLAVVDARGGEPQVLTDRPLGVAGFAWSPDSRRIAFASRTPEPGRYGTTEGVGPGAEDPRRITGFKYRANGLGFHRDKPQGLFVVDVPDPGAEPWTEPVGRAAAAGGGGGDGGGDHRRDGTGGSAPGGGRYPEARAATPAGRDAADPCFSPDGAWLYFTAALHAGEDRDLRSSVYRVPVPRGDGPPADPVAVAGGPEATLSFSSPCFSRDGATLYLLGQELGAAGMDFVASHAGVHAVDAAAPGGPVAAGGAAPRRLSDAHATEYGDGPLRPHGASGVMAFARVRGAGELHAFGPDGARTVLAAGPRVVEDAAEAAGTVVASYTDPRSPGELGRVEGGGIVPLTAFAGPLRAATRIAVPRELTVPSADGYPVHGWVFLPEGPGPHPVLLNIHGGPFSQYGWGYFDEAQVYAEAGYAVVQCNPRGSAGYGREHGLAIRGAMGTVDLQDVLAFLDGAVAAEPALDGARAGILGGSYGGYLTAWTIAHDHRFAAAVVERGFLDPLSFIGSSDIGWFFSEAYTGTDPEHTLTQSPYAVAANVRTPTLVVHSEEDHRCPLEQAQRYYVELLRRGVEAELLLFPGENHELSRSGTPWHRRQRFEAILDWWARHLPSRANPAPAEGEAEAPGRTAAARAGEDAGARA